MRFILLITFLLSTSASYAQTSPDASEIAIPVMQVTGQGLKEMELEKLDVDVKVNQSFSKTSMTMTFRNPNEQDLAGDLVFPLPEGALVSGYALDINGVMVDGSVVKKEKARRVLETEIRKGVDPGLIEFTKGNNYRTRVFPIPAKGVRIVRVSYVSDLIFNNSARLYQLPLGFKDTLTQFNLKINVIKSTDEPTLLNNPLSNFNFKQWEDGFIAQTQLKDIILSKPVTVEIPYVKSDNIAIEQALDGQYYFSIAHKRPNTTISTKVRSITSLSVIWDASGSREFANHKREVAILEKYISKQFNNGSKNLIVHLSVLRNVLSAPIRFDIVNGNTQELIKHIEQIPYDGGTQLSELNDAYLLTDLDLHIIFTDGLSNFGQSYNNKLTVPTTIISGDSKTDHALLRYIAESTGGGYFNLNKLTNDDIVNAIGNTRYSYHSNTLQSGKVNDVLPVSSQSIGDYLVFTGKLNSNDAKVTLNFSNGSKNHDSTTYSLNREIATNGNLLRTVWAQSKVNDLLVHDKNNTQAFIDLGKKYNLVTPETSLLVLETFEQYVEHEVMPPQSLPEMQTKYDEYLANKEKQRRDYSNNKIDSLIKDWNARVEWWNTDFPKEKISKNDNKEEYQEIIVTGHRAVAASSTSRRVETEIVDGLTADEIGDIPALSIGEALETITGASSHGADEESEEDSINLSTQKSSIQLKAWSPDTAYINKLESVKPEDAVNTYYILRKEHKSSLSFFFDTAEFFYEQGNKRFALQVLSNITELDLDNPALNRIVGHRLRQSGEYELSKLMFEEVIRLRPEEPQSYRDLAFVLTEQEQFTPAIELLYSILLKQWDRFDGIELVVLNELNHVIHQAKKNGINEFDIDPRLIKLLDLGVRIVMTWDADLTDIDLHVEEPTGEVAYYSNNLTNIGGLVSRDFTQGYGPEEYLLKKPQKGTYKIKAKYYSNNSPSALGPVTVQLDIYTNYGRDNETHQSTTIQLKGNKEVHEVGEITF